MDKSKLLSQPAMPEEEIKLENIGTIRVRALTRFEIMQLGEDETNKNSLAMERSMLAIAMVDPIMTKAEVEQWQKVSPIEQMTKVINTVNKLSGIDSSSRKDAYKSLRGDTESGI